MHTPSSPDIQPGGTPNQTPMQPASVPAPGPDMLQPIRVMPPPYGPEHFTHDFYARRRPKAPARHRRWLNNWIWVILATGLLGMTLVVTMALILILRTSDTTTTSAAAQSNSNTAPIEPTSIFFSNTGGNTDPSTTGDTPNPVAGEQTEVRGAMENSLVIEPWDGKERFTVLLMGLDRRPGEADPLCTRTDSMMIISIDPINKRIGMLSIPRDLYVEIPNFGQGRINTACRLGDLNEPGSGPRVAMQTVQYNLGIRINDYFMVDFQAFIRFIDRIGGIDVNSPRTIIDNTYPDMYYGYDPVYIEAGPQHLDGATALKYARSRHDSDDTDRARRQQEVVMAAWQRVQSLGILDNLALQALPIYNDFAEGIKTGLAFDQLVQLALYVRNIPAENITSRVITWNYMDGWRTPTGGAVAIPNRYRLGQLMLEVFGEGYNR